METYRRTYFTERGIAVRRAAPAGGRDPTNGSGAYQELDLFAGAVHYWRLERADWRQCLRAARALGLHVIDTYVPWGVHETRAGSYDFGGARDLGAFLDLVAELGMRAIVRPGPHINAELTHFGFPRRVLEESANLAVSGRNTPVWLPAPPSMFPVPSYAARGFQREVRAWLARVGTVVGPRLAPDGPVVAVQVDNESLMFFRLGAYDHDYHPDALAWWHEVAGEIEPPRRWDPLDQARCVRWVRFKEDYTARSLAWITRALEDAGLGDVARFHNLPPVSPTLFNLPRVEQAVAGTAGVDFYHRAGDYADCRRRALYLVGSAWPLPFAPEVGVGGPLWLPYMATDEQKNVMLGVLAAGVRAFNLYMAVARDRWYGAPISERGEQREPSRWLTRLLEVLAEVEWTSLRRMAPVALVSGRADARVALASSVADPLSPVLTELLGLGPAGATELAMDEDAAEHHRWTLAVERALSMAQVPYAIVDEDCAAEALREYQAVIMPTLDRVDRAAWKRLREVAQAGTVVVIGPGKPSFDEYGQPLAEDAAMPPRAGMMSRSSLGDLEGLAADLARLVEDLPDAWMADQADVDCSLFLDADERPRVLFVGNPSGGKVIADIVVVPGTVLMDAMSRERLLPDAEGLVDVPLGAYQVRMFLLES